MKLTIKIALVISLFCSVAFAEGDMTSGGFAEGDMTSGGKTCTANCLVDNQTNPTIFSDKDLNGSESYLLIIVKDFLSGIFR